MKAQPKLNPPAVAGAGEVGVVSLFGGAPLRLAPATFPLELHRQNHCHRRTRHAGCGPWHEHTPHAIQGIAIRRPALGRGPAEIWGHLLPKSHVRTPDLHPLPCSAPDGFSQSSDVLPVQCLGSTLFRQVLVWRFGGIG